MTLLPVLAQHKKVETWYDVKKKILKESYYVLSGQKALLDSVYTSYYITGKMKVNGYYIRGKASGPWEYYYENGNLKMKGLLKDKGNEGKWQYYYENGKLNMEGFMDRGVRDGEWKFYFENERLKAQGSYRREKKEGLWKYYYEDGQFKAQCIFSNDRGNYQEVYPSGNRKSEGDIVGGKSFGLWKYYYENGPLKAEGQEKDGIKEGMWKFYHPSGNLMSEGTYSKGLSEGSWKYYYDNGKLSSEGLESGGKKEGYWKLYYKNGTFKGEGNFVSGDGSYKEYYESGKLKLEGFVKNDRNQGQWKYYYENGTMEGMCFFNEGIGKYTGFYESGKISMEGMIEGGNKTGIWKLYNEDGSIAGYYRTYYENDVPVFKAIAEGSADSTRKDTIAKYAKPKIRIPKRKSRYFIPKVNEFRSLIVSSNPLAIMFYQLPISLEYYFQERLGYELGCIIHRQPFFTAEKNINLNDVFTRGFKVYLRQKFYRRDQEVGMFYFGHELRLSKMDNSVSFADSTGGTVLIKTPVIHQYSMEYSVLIGDRIMGDAKSKGWTIDLFAGIGIGYQLFFNSWSGSMPRYDAQFTDFRRNRISIPFRFGVNIGYAFKKARQ